MPEIPDLEMFAYNLNKKLKNKKLTKVKVHQTRKLKISPAALKKALEQQTLKQIQRSGKELLFQFKNGTVLSIHLMLHGEYHWFTKTLPKFTILELGFGNIGLAITDFQKQATPTLNPEPSEVPDILDVNTAFLKELLQSSDKPLKAVLTDQTKVRGLGNAYIDEICYHCLISPFSISNKIPADKVTKLARSIKTILNNGIRQIKKAQPDIIGGEIRDFMKVHNHKKKTSPSGATIQHKSLGGRKTYYTNEQQLFK